MTISEASLTNGRRYPTHLSLPFTTAFMTLQLDLVMFSVLTVEVIRLAVTIQHLLLSPMSEHLKPGFM